MRREKTKGFVMGVICTVLVMTSVLGAAAATGAVDLSATYRNIKITLNGTELTPKDANGKSVEPFIVDGTTYLPVRAVSEALGLDVSWNNSTNTVVLSGTPVADNGVVNVKNTAELKAALRRSNVEIRMAPGTYTSYDEFELNGVSNVKIIGGDGVKLATNSGTDRVLGMYNCSNVKISGLTMGHELPLGEYYCSSGVLGIYTSYDVDYSNCDIYGCGAMAFDIMDCQNIGFKNCYMHDCSECIGYVSEATASMTDCKLESNGYGEYRTMYALSCMWGSTLTATNCEFKNNHNGGLCYIGEDGENNVFNETGCTYSGNAWQAGPVG